MCTQKSSHKIVTRIRKVYNAKVKIANTTAPIDTEYYRTNIQQKNRLKL